MEDFVTRQKKLPKNVRSFGAYEKLVTALQSFMASLPLITDLKNDALRERHWKKLMQETGKTADQRCLLWINDAAHRSYY